MPLVVFGLGNPGKRFAETRHNVGFEVVHKLEEILSIRLKKPFFSSCMRGKGIYQGKSIILAKPLTYMNRSGMVIPGLLHYARAEICDLIVICDNLDLKPGICKLKVKGSTAGHKGLASVIAYIGTQAFIRFYIGIGRPADNNIIDYVLSKPEGEEKQQIRMAVEKTVSGILLLAEKSPQEVMNVINSKAVCKTKA